jgi:hypothetical protein
MKTLAALALETKAGKTWMSLTEEVVEALRGRPEMLLFDHWDPYRGASRYSLRGLSDGPLPLETDRLFVRTCVRVGKGLRRSAIDRRLCYSIERGVFDCVWLCVMDSLWGQLAQPSQASSHHNAENRQQQSSTGGFFVTYLL